MLPRLILSYTSGSRRKQIFESSNNPYLIFDSSRQPRKPEERVGVANMPAHGMGRIVCDGDVHTNLPEPFSDAINLETPFTKSTAFAQIFLIQAKETTLRDII